MSYIACSQQHVGCKFDQDIPAGAAARMASSPSALQLVQKPQWKLLPRLPYLSTSLEPETSSHRQKHLQPATAACVHVDHLMHIVYHILVSSSSGYLTGTAFIIVFVNCRVARCAHMQLGVVVRSS